MPLLTGFLKDGLSEAVRAFEEWVSSLWRYSNYHFLQETQLHSQRSVTIRKSAQAEGTSISLPSGDTTIFSNLLIWSLREL